jgi:putative hydrolase of the HAD superfamily
VVTVRVVLGDRVRVRAVVFDLLYTLVHPGSYPGGGGRLSWLAGILGVDPAALRHRWTAFEPTLEAGQARSADGCGPELTWVRSTAAELGADPSPADLARIEADWDLTRRAALHDPPADTVHTLTVLRQRGFRLGVLSNTHALELRAWPRSPLAALVDAVSLSHRIGACKPAPPAYQHILTSLHVPAAEAVYLGDGSSNELLGARTAGFAATVLAEHAVHRHAPADLPRLRAQADLSIPTLTDLLTHLPDPP